MKTRFILPLLVLASLISSCNVENESNYTPTIILGNPAKINGDSSIYMSYTDNTHDAVKFDSLHVSDTVVVQVLVNGVSNNVTEFYVIPSDTTSVKVILPDSLNEYFTSQSDFKAGKFILKNESTMLYFPLKFVPKQPKDQFKFDIKAVSDAINITNSVSIQLVFPIKPKR